VRALAAADPANPYGALLPWPEVGGGKSPKRNAGSWVILVAGRPLVYLGAGGRYLLTFPGSVSGDDGALPLALSALHSVPRAGRRRMLIQTIDDEPALSSPLREQMIAAGFEADYDAFAPAYGSGGSA